MGEGEAVGVVLPGADGGLGELVHPVHVVAQRDPVPVDRRGVGQVVSELHLQHLADLGPQDGPGNGAAVAPRLDRPAGQVDGERAPPAAGR